MVPLQRPLRWRNVAAVYNRAGAGYIAYADGDPDRLFDFEGPHAYADRRLWSLLDAKLFELRATGANSVSIVDAGCGPGTWLRRLVMHARAVGFASITARGFDVAAAQIQTARRKARDLAGAPGVSLTFDVADLSGRLPEADRSVDFFLCLYSVLSHLPAAGIPAVAAEAARVTRGHCIVTVRAAGSTPTVFVEPIEKACRFKLNHELDRCEVELAGGHRFSLGFHLFTAAELRRRFTPHFEIEDLCGLDIFHSRFAPDRRWNPAFVMDDTRLSGELAELEDKFARQPGFMERATHLLLVGRRRTAPPSAPADAD